MRVFLFQIIYFYFVWLTFTERNQPNQKQELWIEKQIKHSDFDCIVVESSLFQTWSMHRSSPDSSSFQMPHIDTVMTCNAADSSVLTQPYAVATSSDYISSRRSSVSQNAVTPMRDYGSRIQVLVADTSSVSVSILVIDFDLMQCHWCHHCTVSHFRLVPEAPRWRTQTGFPAADEHCGIKPVIFEKKNKTKTGQFY